MKGTDHSVVTALFASAATKIVTEHKWLCMARRLMFVSKFGLGWRRPHFVATETVAVASVEPSHRLERQVKIAVPASKGKSDAR